MAPRFDGDDDPWTTRDLLIALAVAVGVIVLYIGMVALARAL